MRLRDLFRDLLYFSLLLRIPGYFASQAQDVLLNCEASCIVSVHGESKEEESVLPIALPSPAYNAPWRHVRGDNESSVMSISHTSQPIQRSRSIAIESGLTTCVDHWRKLWRITGSVAFTILVGSSALLQMPGTSGDPLTRCFVFLFILRLVCALASAGILLYYFSKKHFRSWAFAMVWYQNVKRCNQSCFYMPWTIVALPVIAISWGAIFMLVAVFLSVWGDGLYSGVPSVEEVSPLTIVTLRVIITAMSVFDVGWVSCLVVWLKNLDKACKAAQVSAA